MQSLLNNEDHQTTTKVVRKQFKAILNTVSVKIIFLICQNNYVSYSYVDLTEMSNQSGTIITTFFFFCHRLNHWRESGAGLPVCSTNERRIKSSRETCLRTVIRSKILTNNWVD